MVFKSLTILIITMLLSSCSTSRNKKKSASFKNLPVSSIKVTTSENKSLLKPESDDDNENLRKHFDGIVKKAFDEGAESVKFLATDFFIKAMDSSLNGDSYSAAFLLKYSLKLIPDETYILQKYSIELIKIGKIEEAQVIVSKLVKDGDYQDESFALILAGIYTALNKVDKARDTYNIIMKKFPKSVEACTFLGKSLIEAKEFKIAIKHLKNCKKRIPETGIFSFYLGKISSLEEKHLESIKHYKNALKISSDMHEAVIEIGKYYESKEKDKKAIKLYKSFLKKNTESYEVLVRVVELMFKNEKYVDVLPYAESLAELDPRNLNLKVRLGIVYTDFKKYDLAKGIFKEILTVIPDSDKVIYYLASLYQHTGDMELAIDYFSQIKKVSPLYSDSSLQIAQLLKSLAQGNDLEYTEKFISYVEKKSIEIPDLKVDLIVYMAIHLEEVGRFEEAIERLNSISKNKKFSEDHSYLLASLYEKIGNYDDSEKIVETILDKNPDDANALNFLGYSLLERGEDLEKALSYLNRAVKSSPKDGYIQDSLGWYYYKTGEYKKALTQLKKAWKLVNIDPVITRHLAQAYSKLENYEMARKYFFKALELSPSREEKLVIGRELEVIKNGRLPASKK